MENEAVKAIANLALGIGVIVILVILVYYGLYIKALLRKDRDEPRAETTTQAGSPANVPLPVEVLGYKSGPSTLTVEHCPFCGGQHRHSVYDVVDAGIKGVMAQCRQGVYFVMRPK